MPDEESITNLLIAWSEGDTSALNRLVPLVERELRRLARYHLRQEHDVHTLQTSALVNELYLKLVDQRKARWNNRTHFFAVAAQLMRRILVDHARHNRRIKRGGGFAVVSVDDVAVLTPEKSAELLALDDALNRLAAVDPMKARIVELRHFGGLTVDETADVLGVSAATVMRHWSLAKSWLRREVREK